MSVRKTYLKQLIKAQYEMINNKNPSEDRTNVKMLKIGSTAKRKRKSSVEQVFNMWKKTEKCKSYSTVRRRGQK